MQDLHISTHGTGNPLILLHGWGFSSEIWQNLLPTLVSKYQVTLVDLPGHGQSPFYEPFNDLVTLADYLLKNMPNNAIWLGWSLGGLIALYCAHLSKASMKHLLLVASTPKFVKGENWPYGVKPEVMAQFEQQLQADTQATLTRFVNLQVLGLPNARQDARNLSLYIQKNLPSDIGLKWGFELLRTLDLRTIFNQIQCPVNYLLGAKDNLVPVGLENFFKENFPQIKVDIFDSAGHLPFISHPDLFFQWLQKSL